MQKKRKQQAQSTMPIILMVAGAILIVGVLVWQLVQNNSATEKVVQQSEPTLTLDQIDRVSPASAKQAFENQGAVIIDVRSADVYAAEHIAGAINIPLAQISARASGLSKDKWMILYCT